MRIYFVAFSFSILHLCAAWREYTQVSYHVTGASLPVRSDSSIYEWYRPIRIHTYEVDLSQHLTDVSDQKVYRGLVAEGIQLIQQFLQVFPVSDSLRFEYDSAKLCKNPLAVGSRLCKERWGSTMVRETCGVREGFQMPAEHFADFRIYSDETEYVVDIPGGAGVNNTDIVVYISAQSLDYCKEYNGGVLGFAKICKRDQFGRPIASYLNMCPVGFTSVSKAKLRETILHELLHAMGFMGSSILLFIRSCQLTMGQLDCRFQGDKYNQPHRFPWAMLRDNSISRDNYRYELQGLHTLSAWQEHTNCIHTPDTGPVWSVYGLPSATGGVDPVAGDHWTWTSMMGSLMSPFVKEPYMQVLDNITVAWFKDTGWYKVADSLTTPHLWGKNSGCDFGHPTNYCQKVKDGHIQDRFFCQTSGEPGCHYLHLHKGTCTPTESRIPMCQYYKPDNQGECFIPKPAGANSMEEYCEDCRCFVSNLHKSDALTNQSYCYRRRCVEGSLQVHINGSWISCPYNQRIEVDGMKGGIQCPASDVLCTDRDLRLSEYIDITTTTTTTTTTSPTSTPVPTTCSAPTQIVRDGKSLSSSISSSRVLTTSGILVYSLLVYMYS